MKRKLVSIVIPTYNCDSIVKDCFESVKKQTYRPIEVIIVDSYSTDKTASIAKKYGTVYSFGKKPDQKHIFAAPYQRNYGVAKAKGEYIYWVDSDMRLPDKLVETCVRDIEKNHADAVIVPEVSYGNGFWAQCRALEKACYNKSERSYTDAARFVKKSVWDLLGGLDASLGGGDDYDFQARLDDGKYKTIKTKAFVYHFEGSLSLKKQVIKKFIYGKTALAYFKKHGKKKSFLTKQYMRPEFLMHSDLLIKQPIHAVGMLLMKLIEYTAAFSGLLYSQIKKEQINEQRLQ